MITRTNFLDLLGGNTRKYHSCIITSYTFDILFFEQAVLPRLRRAGIRNINIFVDAKMFHKQLENFQGKEYLSQNRDYSITPVFLDGAFHSKSLLAVGNTKGLLAIGSGNITGSGLSNNEEIWSAFHYKNNENLTEGIFSKSIKYLDSLKKYSYAANLKKINWISENSTWYSHLLNRNSDTTNQLDGKSKISIYTTNADSSFFQEIITQVPRNPKEIKILSPYYNKSGKLILKLLEYLTPDKIHCVVDPDYGNIPIELNGHPSIEFSEWSNLSVDKKMKKSLHAKAYQFEYDDSSIFLLGSANATSEAFGTDKSPAKNAEILLKMENGSRRDYFAELGIKFPIVGTLNLAELKINELTHQNDYNQWSIKILHAEFQDFLLKIYLDKILTTELILRIEDADLRILIDKSIKISEPYAEIDIENITHKDIFRCSLLKEGARISNYAYPQNSSDLLGTNPDERLARWGEIRTHDIFEGLGIEVFLDFLNGNKLFEKSSNATLIEKKQEKEEKVPDPITTDEFNKNASNEENENSGQSHLTSLIEDFLSQLVFGTTEEVEISDNVEQQAMGNIEKPANDAPIVHRENNFSYSEGLRIRKKLENVLTRIIDYVDNYTINLYLRSTRHSNDLNLGIDHLNAQLIGLSLILKYLSRPFDQKSIEITISYDEIKKLNSLEKKYSLVRHAKQNGNPNGIVSYDLDINYIEKIVKEIKNNKDFGLIEIDKDNIKENKHCIFDPYLNQSACEEFMINNLGRLLYAILKEKILVEEKQSARKEQQINKILQYSILLIYNFNWSKKDLIYRDLILLNILNSFPKQSSFNQVVDTLKTIAESENNHLELEGKNITHLNRLISKYQSFIEKVKSNSSNIKEELDPILENRIIYSTSYGFAILKDVKTNKRIDLETPLGIDYQDKNLYGFSDVFIGENVKVFEN
ncbi:hypothetical protein [Christiangramia salexigens]|uniref:PLD phosphodiesterase domain-containing protein n=1 Tax=Christiangramia salexigens TaxID=1913577 RepID=A0A1L3J1L2_9FLAO|nr:hypothetical protein [Christiangramia salexigens]APG59015.1 hypothetical protein LPB144_00730 [Christiangramia salexigens]